jgi:5-methylcytosine-specific restriction endonuclease McrA
MNTIYRKSIQQKIKRIVLARGSYQCVYCLVSSGPFEIDHVHPVSRGGTNDPRNLVVACRACNRAKWAHPVGLFAARLSARGVDSVAAILGRVQAQISAPLV